MNISLGPSRASGAAERSIGCQRHCFSKDASDRIVGTPTNPKPDGAARDPLVRRQYITQRWLDKNSVIVGCFRCEGRGTMSHSETCRKRFEKIERRKLDKQLEEVTRNAEPLPVGRPLEGTSTDSALHHVLASRGWSLMTLGRTGLVFICFSLLSLCVGSFRATSRRRARDQVKNAELRDILVWSGCCHLVRHVYIVGCCASSRTHIKPFA